MIDRFILKLSGAIFEKEHLIPKYADLIRRLWERDFKFAIVTGGGLLARKYVELGRKFGLNESILDLLGIQVSRLNALLLAGVLGDIAYLPIPSNIDEVLKAWSSGRLLIAGGLQPGQSTATVAVLLAELLGLKAIIDCANIDAVYTADPKVDPNARKFERISIDELIALLKSRALAGTYDLLDPWALNIAKRSSITIYVIHHENVDQVERLITTGCCAGTVITP